MKLNIWTVLLFITLAFWLFPFWFNWYFENRPTGHGIVNGIYTELDFGTRGNMIFALKSVVGCSIILSLISLVALIKLEHRKKKMVIALSAIMFLSLVIQQYRPRMNYLQIHNKNHKYACGWTLMYSRPLAWRYIYKLGLTTMLLRIILLTTILALSGCATYYQNPTNSSSAELIGTFEKEAEFKQFLKNEGFGPQFSRFIVMPGSVDGVTVGLHPVPTYILPGKREIGIRVYDKADKAEFIFSVKVEENGKYMAKFSVENQDGINIIDAWLEDASNGEKITSVQRRQATNIQYPNAPLIL